MKALLSIALSIWTGFAFAASSAPETVRAEELLADVAARLPREQLEIDGSLSTRRRHGMDLQEREFTLHMHLAADPPMSRYTIRDAFGRELEELTIRRPSGTAPEFRYRRGSMQEEAHPPSLGATIPGTALTWMDLTLDFLWWRNGTVSGTDTVKGRACYRVDLPVPEGVNAQYARVRLWVDREMRMLLQAEGYNAEGRPLRTLWVRSFKRIDERWMIRDMEIHDHLSALRTRLRIREVNENTSP